MIVDQLIIINSHIHLKYNLEFETMISPETPTLRRKFSNKRIVISSPSQQMLHFLTLPNPSASQDPRQRLHIMTPKNKERSASLSSEDSKQNQSEKRKPSTISRVTFIRKKALNQSWAKNSTKNQANKLTISTNYQSRFENVDKGSKGLVKNSCCRLNFTFGENQFLNFLKV